MRYNAWHRRPFLAYDVESTGISVDHDRIVTATICHIDGADVSVWQWLLNPGIEIPQGATDVHGVTTEHAREHGQDPAQSVGEIASHIDHAASTGVPVVAFNAAYDFSILHRECLRHGVEFGLPNIIDPHVQDKALDKYRKGKRTLTAVCEHYGVRLDGAHDATQDALAAARVAWVLAERYPDELQIDLAHLHANQKAWRADQAAGLQRYFRKTDPNAYVAPEWPLIPAPADWTPDQLPAPREDAA